MDKVVDLTDGIGWENVDRVVFARILAYPLKAKVKVHRFIQCFKNTLAVILI